MKQELEIGGKTYILVANRNVSTIMEKCVRVDNKGNAMVDMPDKSKMLYALLKKEQPEISELEAEKLLEMADEEYGVGQMNMAIEQMVNSVFTQGSNTSQKTISWLTKTEDETEE